MNIHTLKAEFAVQLAKQIDPDNSPQLANIILQLMVEAPDSGDYFNVEKGTGDFNIHCDRRGRPS